MRHIYLCVRQEGSQDASVVYTLAVTQPQKHFESSVHTDSTLSKAFPTKTLQVTRHWNEKYTLPVGHPLKLNNMPEHTLLAKEQYRE